MLGRLTGAGSTGSSEVVEISVPDTSQRYYCAPYGLGFRASGVSWPEYTIAAYMLKVQATLGPETLNP